MIVSIAIALIIFFWVLPIVLDLLLSAVILLFIGIFKFYAWTFDTAEWFIGFPGRAVRSLGIGLRRLRGYFMAQ